MALTDKEVKAAKPAQKPYKLADGGGLHLLVTPAGGRLWRLKYRVAGREKQLAFGAYPDVSLADAREARDKAKAALRRGTDPGLMKRLGPAPEETFEAVARAWHERTKSTWTARHAEDVLTSLERLVFPKIGPIRVSDLGAPEVLAVLRAIEQNNGGETANRIRQRMSAVFVSAIAHGIAQTDPAAIVKGAMAPVIRGRMPAVTSLNDARDVLAKVEALPAHPVTKWAHRFLALTLVRPDNVNGARWDEINMTDPHQLVWEIPAARMKMKTSHVVPLTPAAKAVLEAVRPLTGKSPFVFPNSRFAHRPMSENALNYACQRAGLGGVHVPHGWRATFSSIMNELRPTDADAIERILAHASKDAVRAAYNRAEYMQRRAELLQEWANLLLAEAPAAVALLEGPRRTLKRAA
jgi:integrase